jgi:hypothetical protein
MERPLTELLKLWRAERPDEWTMDEFIREAERMEKLLQNTSSNCDYAVAVKNLINSEVDCVQTKNGAYVNLDGVIDCLNRALHNFA